MTSREAWWARLVDACESGIDTDTFFALHPDAPPSLRDDLPALRSLEALLAAQHHGTPRRLGPWTLHEELGRGATSVVYRAEHDGAPGVARALKCLAPDHLGDERQRRRFERECTLLRDLDVPGIARVVEAGALEGRPYLALEWVEGHSLADAIDATRNRCDAPPCRLPHHDASADPWSTIARLVATLARSVAALHDVGVVHRDIKPSNVVLNADGAPTLVDFGLASDHRRSTLTGEGALLGTLPWMAPEQARGEEVGPAADLFGLGAVLYELLTLRPPHHGDDPVAVLRRAQRHPVDDVRAHAPDVPAPLATITARATAFRSRRRTEDARALADDLDAFVAGRAIRSRRRHPIERWGDRWASVPRTGQLAVVSLFLVLTWWIGLGPDTVSEARTPSSSTRMATHVRHAALAWADLDRDVGTPDIEAALDASIEALPDHGAGESWRTALRILQLPDTPLDATAAPWLASFANGERTRRDGDAASALRHFQDAADHRPGSPLIAACLARTALSVDDAHDAESALYATLHVLPEADAVRRHLADRLARRGRALYEAGRLEDAERVVLEATRHDPKSEAAWHQLAFVRKKLGDVEGAVNAARRQLALPAAAGSIRHDRALRTLAVALDREGRRHEALSLLDGILSRHPGYVEARFSRALILDGLCRIGDACADYLATLEESPNSASALAGLIHLHSGSNRAGCEACRDAFAERPELLDPAAAEAYAIRFLHSTKGARPGLDTILGYALRVGPCLDLREALDRRIADESDDTRLGRLVRARRLFDE